MIFMIHKRALLVRSWLTSELLFHEYVTRSVVRTQFSWLPLNLALRWNRNQHAIWTCLAIDDCRPGYLYDIRIPLCIVLKITLLPKRSTSRNNHSVLFSIEPEELKCLPKGKWNFSNNKRSIPRLPPSYHPPSRLILPMQPILSLPPPTLQNRNFPTRFPLLGLLPLRHHQT